MATTNFQVKNPKVNSTKWEKVPPMPKGGDVTKATQVGTTTKPIVKKPIVATTSKATVKPNIGATPTPKYSFVAPTDYNTGLSTYRSLANSKDPTALKQRRDLASWLSKNKPTIGAGTPSVDAGTGAGTPPPTGAGNETDTFDPMDYVDSQIAEQDNTGAGLIDPTLCQEVLNNLSKQGQWNPNVRMPTQQELADLYAKNYEQQLADLSYGVEGKQQQIQKAREQHLADKGISIDSQAYRNELANLAEQRATEDALLRTQARAFAQEQANAEFDRALKGSQMEMDKARLEQDLKYRGVEALSPLAMSEAQLKNNRWLAQFDAKTQGAFLKANLDQNESQFIRGLNQEQQQWLGDIAQKEMDRAQNQKQFETNMKQIVTDFKTRNKQWKVETLNALKRDKTLTQLKKEKLAEMVRANKANEMIAMLNAKKAGGSSSPSIDDLYNRAMALGEAQIDIEKRRKEEGLDPTPAGGISYGFGG